MFEAEKMLKMVLTQASVINKRWQSMFGIERIVTTQTKIESYLSLKQQRGTTITYEIPKNTIW